MSCEKAKATAKVNLETGEHVNYFPTRQAAEMYVLDANQRSEAMGLVARYVASDFNPNTDSTTAE